MKICRICNIPKPATAEYFYRRAENRGRMEDRGRMENRCKECISRLYYSTGTKEKTHKRIHQKTHTHRTAFSHLRKRVKREGKYKFLLGEARTPEAEAYIKYLQTITHCPDCAKEMVWFSVGKMMNPDSASFDRMDSDGDYIKENVRIVCRHCNARKNDSPVDEWVGQLEVRVRKGIIECIDETLVQFLSESKDLN